MKPYVQIAIRTKSATNDWSFGDQLIDSLSFGGGLLAPELISNNPDKFTNPFLGKDASKDIWTSKLIVRGSGTESDFFQDFAWRRKKVLKCTGRIVHATKNIKGQVVPGDINFRSEYSQKIDWFLLFKLWIEIFPAQLGMLHLFSGAELDPALKNNSFQIGSFNSLLKPQVSDLGWAMFFGEEFVKEVNFGRMSDMGCLVDEFARGYLVRVTSDMQDVVDDFLAFSDRRALAKSIFPESFCPR